MASKVNINCECGVKTTVTPAKKSYKDVICKNCGQKYRVEKNGNVRRLR